MSKQRHNFQTFVPFSWIFWRHPSSEGGYSTKSIKLGKKNNYPLKVIIEWPSTVSLEKNKMKVRFSTERNKFHVKILTKEIYHTAQGIVNHALNISIACLCISYSLPNMCNNWQHKQSAHITNTRALPRGHKQKTLGRHLMTSHEPRIKVPAIKFCWQKHKVKNLKAEMVDNISWKWLGYSFDSCPYLLHLFKILHVYHHTFKLTNLPSIPYSIIRKCTAWNTHLIDYWSTIFIIKLTRVLKTKLHNHTF